MISTLSCNAVAKVLTLQKEKRLGQNETLNENNKRNTQAALTTDPNGMMTAIGSQFNKALVWTQPGRQTYQYWVTFMTQMHRQNLRLALIINFIFYCTMLLWWFF